MIELMAVMATIGFLASVTVPSLESMQKEANVTKAQAEIKILQTIVERYHTRYGSFPENLDLTKLSNQINITDKQITDPFHTEAELYGFKTGRTNESKDFYIIYSRGFNGQTEFIVDNNQVYNKGDDILASNLPVLK